MTCCPGEPADGQHAELKIAPAGGAGGGLNGASCIVGTDPGSIVPPAVTALDAISDPVPFAVDNGIVGKAPILPGPVAEADQQSCASSEEPPPVPWKVNGRFEIRGQLGSGSYSVVHLGYDLLKKEDVAVKFEWVDAKKGRRLMHEAALLTSMAGTSGADGFPRVRWWGNQDQYNIMVMELLGPSLEYLFKKCGKQFSTKTTVMLAEQMIDRIQFVHSCGIVHRDIKPHNFLVGAGDAGEGKVYIMDFGLAKRYLDPETGAHIPCVKKRGVTGTVRYTSLNVHKGLEPSRRDDLGAIGYVLMQFQLGRLPWQGISAQSNRTKQKRIGRKKEQTTHEELCKGFPDEFATWLSYCDSLSYAERPDYDHLRSLLRAICAKHEFVMDGKFDWTGRAECSALKEKAMQEGLPSRALEDRVADEAAEGRSRSPRRRKHGWDDGLADGAAAGGIGMLPGTSIPDRDFVFGVDGCKGKSGPRLPSKGDEMEYSYRSYEESEESEESYLEESEEEDDEGTKVCEERHGLDEQQSGGKSEGCGE